MNIDLSEKDLGKVLSALGRELEILNAGPDDDYKETIEEYKDLVLRIIHRLTRPSH